MTLNSPRPMRSKFASSSFSKKLFRTALPLDVRRRLCLAGKVAFSIRARPLVRAVPCALTPIQVEWNQSGRSKTEPRAQPGMRAAITARQSHRLTSGGKAVNNQAPLFGCGSVRCASAARPHHLTKKPGHGESAPSACSAASPGSANI